MECDEARAFLTAYVDDELSLREAAEIERHLRTCAGCREESARQQTVRAALRESAVYYRAAPALARRVKAALPVTSTPPRRAFGRWGWANVGVALVSLVAFAWTAGIYLTQPSTGERIAQDVVSSHIRSLLSSHPVDVSSSNQHTVKPWFNGKLDYSPPVYDLAADGFPLMGGRVDYLDRRPVAALVYRYRLHYISVYILPVIESASILPAAESQEGFHVIHWHRGGMDFWAVSDVNISELERFQQLFLSR